MSYLKQEVLVRKVELTSNHQREEFGQGPKETPVQMSYQPPRIHLSGIHLGATRKDPESERLAKDNLETNPITTKSKSSSHVAEQSSWISLPYCSPPGCPFPIKSLALSAHVSLNSSFPVLDKSPLSGPGRGSPSCNKTRAFPLYA